MSSSAPTSRCTRTCRCTRRCSRPRRSSRPSAPGARCGGCSASSRRALGHDLLGGDRSRHADRRALPARHPRTLTARRRRGVRRRAAWVRPRGRARLGRTSRCCPTVAGGSRRPSCSSASSPTTSPAPVWCSRPVVTRRGATRSATGRATTTAHLHLHPDDAADAAVADGDRVAVVSQHGSLDVTVVVDHRMRAGAVSLVHGRRGRSPGTLVSARADVDAAHHDAPHLRCARAAGAPPVS